MFDYGYERSRISTFLSRPAEKSESWDYLTFSPWEFNHCLNCHKVASSTSFKPAIKCSDSKPDEVLQTARKMRKWSNVLRNLGKVSSWLLPKVASSRAVLARSSVTPFIVAVCRKYCSRCCGCENVSHEWGWDSTTPRANAWLVVGLAKAFESHPLSFV